MKKLKWWIGLLVVVLFLGACQSNANDSEDSQVSSDQNTSSKVVIGTFGSDLETWEFIAQSRVAKDAGLEIELIDMAGRNANVATLEGDLDANAFQSYAYLQAFNAESDGKLVPLAFTYMEPMGIYSEKYQSLDALPEGARLAIPSDASETSRALKLLQQAGLITIDPDHEGLYTVDQITENPKHFVFEEIQDETVPRALPDVDAGIFGNTIAENSGYYIFEDALYVEQQDKDNIGNYNVIVTNEANSQRPELQKLGDLYHTKEVQDFIADKFNKTKVEITESIDNIANN